MIHKKIWSMEDNTILEISIPSAVRIGSHTEYQIVIISNISELKHTYIRTYKRYSEIRQLHKKIKKFFPVLPDFPKKTWFKKNNPEVVDYRRRTFQIYLSYILGFILKNELKSTYFAKEVFNFLNS